MGEQSSTLGGALATLQLSDLLCALTRACEIKKHSQERLPHILLHAYDCAGTRHTDVCCHGPKQLLLTADLTLVPAPAVQAFPEENAAVQLQLVTAAVKLFLKCPQQRAQQMIQLVLTYATQARTLAKCLLCVTTALTRGLSASVASACSALQ